MKKLRFGTGAGQGTDKKSGIYNIIPAAGIFIVIDKN
jgi:hypothetical protein